MLYPACTNLYKYQTSRKKTFTPCETHLSTKHSLIHYIYLPKQLHCGQWQASKTQLMKKFSKPWLPCSQKRNPKAKRISPILEDSITTSDFRSFVYQTLERRRLNMTALHTTFGVLRTFRQSFKSSMQRLFTNLNSQNKPPPPNVDRQYHDH